MIDWGQKSEIFEGLKRTIAAAGRMRMSYGTNHVKKVNRVQSLTMARNAFAKESERILRKMDAEITRTSKVKEVWRG